MRTLAYITLAITCIFLLYGCGSKQVVATPPRLVLPPSYLLDDCRMTPFTDLKTNAGILISFQALYLDFKECNKQKAILRNWYHKMEQANKQEKE